MSQFELSGHCLCGAVTVDVNPSKPHLEACHCDMCRRWCGAAYIAVQAGNDVRFTGEEHITRYKSSDWAERGFCNQCGSNLFYHFVPLSNYSFTAGLFDDLGDKTLTEEIFVDEQPGYYSFEQKTERKTGAEVIAEAEAAGFKF
ncbi:MAG: GFA family protein [Erythrobacter sp.]